MLQCVARERLYEEYIIRPALMNRGVLMDMTSWQFSIFTYTAAEMHAVVNGFGFMLPTLTKIHELLHYFILKQYKTSKVKFVDLEIPHSTRSDCGTETVIAGSLQVAFHDLLETGVGHAEGRNYTTLFTSFSVSEQLV